MPFRDSLFALPAERTIEPVETPAGRTFVRSLMVGEKDRFDTAAVKDGMFRARLVLACCCNEAGHPEFQSGDLERVNDMPVGLLEPIVDAALRLNGMRPDDAGIVRKN